MTCPRCQTENPLQAKFCLECAAPLVARCANCGSRPPPRPPTGRRRPRLCADPEGRVPGPPAPTSGRLCRSRRAALWFQRRPRGGQRGPYWRQHEAAQFITALEDEPIYLEQPCRTLGECLAIRRRTARPMILDETLTDLDALFAAQAAGAMDCAMLELSRFGDISRLRLPRDVCRQWGLAMTMEDAGGGDVVTAAMAHLAASTPSQSLLNGMLINMLVNERIADGTPAPRDGWSEVSRRPGLGITVDEKALGAPLFSIT